MDKRVSSTFKVASQDCVDFPGNLVGVHAKAKSHLEEAYNKKTIRLLIRKHQCLQMAQLHRARAQPLKFIWKSTPDIDSQITQTLKFRFAQYMGNHRKHLFWPTKLPTPFCTLCPPHTQQRDTWPHLLAICNRPVIHRLRIT